MTPTESGVAMRRVLLIVNPASRRGVRAHQRVIRTLSDLGIECESLLTEHPGHAAELAARHAPGHDAVFTLGGDGTAMEVVGALAPDGPPVGILPGGTGNLVARALGIPLRIVAAVRTLSAGYQARIDLGRLDDGRRFMIGAGVGIDAAMIATTSTSWKRRVGVLAYMVAGTRHALRRRRFGATVTVDGETVTCEASAVLVANFGVLLSGLITLGDGIRYDDGILNVCIFDPRTLRDATRIALRLIRRDFTPDPVMTYLHGRTISISTDPPLPAQADGELIGTTPLAMVTQPLAARLLVPRRG